MQKHVNIIDLVKSFPVKTEQFVYEFAKLNEDTGTTTEARMDIIAEMPGLRAMLDIRVFLPLNPTTASSQWKSTRANEIEKHARYVTHEDGRRCSNMKLYAAVVNTYGKVGQDFVDFSAVIDNINRGKARGRSLTNLLSLLGVYANAEKVLLAHAPSNQRAQRRDVQAAIAAKDAQAEAAAQADAAKAAQAPPKLNSKATKCPELRGNISFVKGVRKIWCLKCKEPVNYTGWSDHCTKKHPVDGPAIEKDEGADRPGRRTVEAGGAASRKEAAKTAAPGRRQKAPSGDKGTQKTKKASVAPKEK